MDNKQWKYFERVFLYEKNAITLKNMFDFICLKIYNFTNFKFIIYFREICLDLFGWITSIYLDVNSSLSSHFEPKIAMVFSIIIIVYETFREAIPI